MHHRMLITTSLPDGASSEDARLSVHEALLNDDSFCGNGGRFGTPLCDWFVIGGRWSGLLAATVIGTAYEAVIQARFPELAREWWPESIADQHAGELDSIWQAHGGTGPSPYSRSCYEEFGHSDDAMLLTMELYVALLAQYEGLSLDRDSFADLDGDELQPDFVGRKWLVVVDYHN